MGCDTARGSRAQTAARLVPVEFAHVARCLTPAIANLRNNAERRRLVAGGSPTEPAVAHVLVQAAVPQATSDSNRADIVRW